ncbi:MAG: beta-hydroxyacyl-ACP dehydratase [Pirellulales bacterium]|nr:beta-hydroxyacyl-ACP dehydratase [Pirellulales bacterium]
MRWYWIDRFIEFESGRRARAVKAISLAEEHLHDHFADYPTMPAALVIEGIAQTGGLLVCEFGQFTEKVVLAKIAKARFYAEAVPGDVLVYTAEIEYVKKDGAMVIGTAHRGDELFAEMELVFAHLSEGHESRTLFEPKTFLKMMRMLGAFEVGRAADGSRLLEPIHLADA